MRFFRNDRRIALLGLLALALQFFAAFAHHHSDGEFGHQHHIASATALIPADADVPDLPEGDDHHICEICWTTSLASAALVPAPSELVVHIARTRATEFTVMNEAAMSRQVASFEARGPPHA